MTMIIHKNMHKKLLWIGITFLFLSLQAKANLNGLDSTYKRWFIGSTLLLVGNFDPVNNPEFVQLNLGYRITPKDVISFEFKRSIYSWPLAIPWGPSFDAPGLNYPGHVRILAPTIAYQRFWWKGAYTAIHALNAFEKFLDKDNQKLGNGYTLYTTFRLGYQLNFFKKRFFFEPSIGFTYWPIRTHVPASFKAVESPWPNYFGWEPGLHIGYNFNFKPRKSNPF
ncbi:MAG: hypothetical protein L6Q78_11560 [Bacteroidia bacterium]|nr:hypothetical protein [Bacteroidia bacterium]